MSSIWILSIMLFGLAFVDTGFSNTPPHISFAREWILMEDDPVGTIATRIDIHDADDDDVKVRIGKPSSKAFNMREDGDAFFTIDSEHRVKLAKSLKGMAGETFLVGIIASDGHLPNRVDAKVTIRRPNDPFKPRLSGLPPSFDPGPPPPLEDIPRATFSEGSGPPLLHLDHNTVWKVPHDIEVGAQIDVIEAQDLSHTFLKFSLKPDNLLKIDQNSGEVVVAKSLKNHVGIHKVEVKVSNRDSSITEIVTLKVFRKGEEDEDEDLDGSFPYETHEIPKGGNLDPSAPTLEINEGVPPENKARIGMSVVVMIFVFGVIPLLALGGFLLYRWRRKKKMRAEAKESSVSYSEKRSSLSQEETGERRDSIIGGIFQMVGIHKRAESNGYEDDSKVPKVPNRESKSTKSRQSSTEEKDAWEFPRHKLRFLGILGEGCFGQVWKCEATDMNPTGEEDGPTIVAVKTLKESAGSSERKDLLQEMKVLKSLGHHPNVVSLLGCCTEKDPILVILENMVGGTLQNYLRASRAEHAYGNLHGVSASLTPRDLTIFALQAARGMDFLSKRGIIHRDLAARNVLIGENKICKVADFGFARDVANNRVYERKSDGRLPIRWMAPESLFDNIFTTKSDVWSFGILLWEIVTLGSIPYPGMSAQEVMRRVKEGYRLDKPDHCRREIYNIMYYCWDFEQNQRPTFCELISMMEALIMSEVEYIHLDNFPNHYYYNFSSSTASGELL